MAINSSGYLTNISREEMQRPVKDSLRLCTCFKWSPVISIANRGTCSARGGVNSQGTISTLHLLKLLKRFFTR